VPESGYLFVPFSENEKATWIRISSAVDLDKTSAVFTYHNSDSRTPEADSIFKGIATSGDLFSGGALQALGNNRRTMAFHATNESGERIDSYELDAELNLKPTPWSKTEETAEIPTGVLSVEASSILYVDDKGKRWRLPKGDSALDKHEYRVCREVATERDLFNAHGTFYELPAENAGGFSKVRPVASHNRFIHDFCSYRGLFVVSGIATNAPTDNPHIIRSKDGKAAVWAGAIDDIWKLGKPRGQGGPWLKTKVEAGKPSDPYLMTAYDKKTLTLSADKAVTISAEIDLTGEGRWATYATFDVKPGVETKHEFPEEFQAYWIRLKSSAPCEASAQLEYR